MNEPKAIRKKIEIDTIYIPDYPEIYYKVPMGQPGWVLIVSETPEYGIETKIVKEDSPENPFNGRLV